VNKWQGFRAYFKNYARIRVFKRDGKLGYSHVGVRTTIAGAQAATSASTEARYVLIEMTLHEQSGHRQRRLPNLGITKSNRQLKSVNSQPKNFKHGGCSRTRKYTPNLHHPPQ
jgi:hypothetical protein